MGKFDYPLRFYGFYSSQGRFVLLLDPRVDFGQAVEFQELVAAFAVGVYVKIV